MIVSRLVELLAPVECLGCGIEGAVLCAQCVAEAGVASGSRCFRCGRNSVRGRTCRACLRHTGLDGVTVGARYEGAVKELILQLKFHRLRAATGAAAELVLAGMTGQDPVDVITSVPVSAGRYRERGYNQSELVARTVATRLGLPYRPLLGRATSTHQIGGDRRTRFEQVAGAFYAARRLEGQRVLVVDDVVTTGATLSECAGVLKDAGAGTVWAAAVARH